MNAMNKTSISKKLAALLLAIVLVFAFAAAGCDLGGSEPEATPEPSGDGTVKTEGNPVVISSPKLDYTLYDFRTAYYGNQDYVYMMYGMMSQSDYFDEVVESCENFLCIYNAAVDAGYELDDEDIAEIDKSFDEQLESIISQYSNDVDESVTDETARREAAIELLNNDLASDGLDYDTFAKLAKNNMYANTIVDKYFTALHEAVEISDEEVSAYIDEQLASSGEMTMDSFRSAYEAYCSGQGAFPVYVPDDCFSVDHIFLAFETSSDENGGVVYNRESTVEKENAIESKLPQTADYAAFMELETEYGEDPGMDEEAYRENGYLIHPDFDYQYFTGFVYAAMNLKSSGWVPSPNPSTGEVYELPELKYFTLADGTGVVKTATESGIHYIIINKTFTKGAVAYENGDAHWESWEETVRDNKFSEQYEELLKSWKEQYPITVYTEVFKAEFVPADSESTGESDAGSDAAKK